MKKFLFLMLIPTMVAAQQTINGLNIKGKLDVISTTKSSNPCPSMTEAQRDLIIVPATGSCVYNTNALSLNIYDGAEWKSAGDGGISLWLTLTDYKTDDVVIDSNKIYKSLSDHTSGVFATDLANGNWVEISANDPLILTGEATNVGSVVTLDNAAVIAKELTGFTSGAGLITATDTILSALQKADGNAALKLGNTQSDVDIVPVATTQLNAPASQLTTVSTNTRLIETGNDNLLANPSFESPLIETLGTLGWSSNANKSFSTDAVDGKQAIVITGNTGLSRMPKIMSTMIAINGATLANQIIIGKVWYKGAGLNNSSICILPTDGSGPIDADRVCTEFGDSNGLWITKTASLRVKSTYIGYQIILGSYTVSSNSETFDKAYASIYDPKDQATILGFKNTTKLESCGLTAADFQGFGTPTNINLNCARDGEFLIMNGSFVSGSSTAVLAQLNLKYKGQNLTVSNLFNLNETVGDYFRGVSNENKGGTLLAYKGHSYLRFGRVVVFGSTATNPLDEHNGNTIAGLSERLSINARIPIAEWSENTNGALITCKEGPLKCANTYTGKLSSTQVLSDLNIPNWLTCTGVGSGAVNCVYNPNIVLASPMNCSADFGANGAISTDVYGPMVFPQTITGFTIRTWNSTASTGTYKDVIISCTKTGSDYNAGYEKVLGFTEDADIRSTEWLTGGFDYISGKPIYKRCHRVTSDITTNGATLVTWPANLNPIGLNNVFADLWSILSYSTGANGSNIGYVKTSGLVAFEKTGSLTKIGSGTTFCMEYVK